ncbi:MAG: asparaginase [Lentisphaerae bacterium GWF2_44_16]|nr:MAG: asparaginase [Lentisphaerae bacterium GWF2_44_16]
MKIKIYTAGGTIDKIYFDKKNSYHIGDSILQDLLKEGNVNFEYEIKDFMKKDSLDMTDEDRYMLAEKISGDECDRILVTHGTDTMVNTAKILKKEIRNKIIVLTGSMFPARFRSSDAVFNVAFAAASLQLLGNGTYIAMNGLIFDPDNAVKNIQLNRFEKITQ